MIFEYSSGQIPTGPVSEKIAPALRDLKARSSVEGYESHSSFVGLPKDQSLLNESLALASKMRGEKLKFVFLIGIGGSLLGVRAIASALLRNDMATRLVYLGTIDDNAMKDAKQKLAELSSADEFAVVLVSKSGATTETVTNFALIEPSLVRFDDWKSRVVIVTDEGSALEAYASNQGFAKLNIPKMVGGRYSVFSPVGVFPLALAGLWQDDIIAGAKEVINSLDSKEGATQLFAEDIDRSFRGGVRILDQFFFSTEFEDLGKWARQLWAESLGKPSDRDGYPIHVGLLPTVSIGTEDLHSMLQFYLGGPRDRMTLFIPSTSGGEKIPESSVSTLVAGIAGRTSSEVMAAIYGGVRAAYRERGLASVEVKPGANRAHFVGAFMQWQMCVVTVLGEVWNIDAFDQPSIEEYKKVTREILSQK